jgi:4-nitrophenyl phosphatase
VDIQYEKRDEEDYYMNDYFGKDAGELKNKKLFLLDMDGTIYKEERLFEGALDLLKSIEDFCGRYVFITNNSSKSVNDYIAKIRGMGISADIDNFFTSAQATILLLKKEYPDVLVYCQGTRSLVSELDDAGIKVTTEVEDGVELILVGFDTELTSQKLRNTCELLGRDIPFYATNPDLACPASFGFIPDCGSICQMLENATGRKPIYVGKPKPIMVDIVCEKFDYGADETVVIGDRLYTDIATGLNAGVTAICVLTGEATVETIEKEERKPTFTFYSVKEINEAITTPRPAPETS